MVLPLGIEVFAVSQQLNSYSTQLFLENLGVN